MSQRDIFEARKAELKTLIDGIVTAAEAETRAVTDDEQTVIDGHVAEFRTVSEKITKLEEREALLASQVVPDPFKDGGAPAAARTELRTEPYRAGGRESYFMDLNRAQKGDHEARERLIVNDRHRADKLREARAGATTVAGAGGEFAPPLWQEDKFIAYLRAGRVFADRLNKVDLPVDVSSINLPKVATGTAVATQGTQNTAINIQDITTSSVSTGITTIAGGTTIALQLLKQSPISMDDVILKDLAKALAKQIDLAAITAVAGVSGLNGVTYTDAAPTSLKITGQVQAAIDAVSNAIFEAPNTIVMRPERWGKLIAAGDSTGRPLVLPKSSYGANNTLGEANGQTAQGYAGNLRGVDVFLDANIPVNLGAGTNQDEIFVLKADEINLYESAPSFETFEQTYAQNLSLFIRAYEFYGIIANRYPGAIGLITGTGLVNTLAYGS